MSTPAFVWLNGSIVPTAEARVSPFDHGLTVGDGVFETLPDRGLGPVALTRHWQRLVRSCVAMGIEPPTIEVMRGALRKVMVANALTSARLRFTVTGGLGPVGSDKGDAPPTLLAVAVPLTTWPAATPVVTVKWTRNELDPLAGVKSTSYGGNVVALAHAKKHGAGEAIFANTRGDLCEGTGSNVFIFKDGIALTSPLDSGCLAGVTRALVLDACQRSGVPAQECRISMGDFLQADEAFLTSSTREVHPILAINGRTLARVLGDGTQAVAAAFAAFVAQNVDA
ncbi:MAG: aminotransferase class IV [Verrucomicrobiaceae bacterium]